MTVNASVGNSLHLIRKIVPERGKFSHLGKLIVIGYCVFLGYLLQSFEICSQIAAYSVYPCWKAKPSSSIIKIIFDFPSFGSSDFDETYFIRCEITCNIREQKMKNNDLPLHLREQTILEFLFFTYFLDIKK